MSNKGMRIRENKELNVNELSQYLREKDITLQNIKAVLEELDSSKSVVRSLFDIHLPALKKIEAIPHDEKEVHLMLHANATTELMYACVHTIGMKNRVDTLTTVPLVMTMNQLNMAQVEFRGGNVPKYNLAKIEEMNNNSFNSIFSEEEQEPEEIEKDGDGKRIVRVAPYKTSHLDVVNVGVCAGLPIFKKEAIDLMGEKYGIKEVITAAPDAINLAVICAGALDLKTVVVEGKRKTEIFYHQFGDPRKFPLEPPFKGNTLITPTLNKCRQTFDLPATSKEGMVHEIATFLTAHPQELAKIPRSDVQTVKYKNGYKGTLFEKMSLTHLEGIWSQIRNMASKYLKLIKNQDTGFSAINAPLKWTPVLGYIQGDTPYVKVGSDIVSNDGYDRNTKLVYYGAAGGRMDAMVRSYYFDYDGRDLKEFNGTSKKVNEEDLKRLKVPRWKFADVAAYTRGDETVMISDIFMKSWNGKNGNAIMSRFVAGLLRGCIVVGNDERSYGSTDKFTVAAKMMTPDMNNLVEFQGTYPFIMAKTCRPTTNEIILIKDFEFADSGYEFHDQIVGLLGKNFDDKSIEGRLQVIRNQKQFEEALRVKIAAQISEVFMQMDRLTIDWKVPSLSKKHRKWFLAAPQMPNLYRSSKICASLGDNSWSFDPVMGEIMQLKLDGYDLASDFKEEDIEEVPLENRRRKEVDKGKKEEDEPIPTFGWGDPTI